MNIALPTRLTVDEFLAWAVRQTEGKCELVDGVVIKQQAQHWGHSKVKAAAHLALQQAIAAAGVPYYVGPDGPTRAHQQAQGVRSGCVGGAIAGAGIR